MSDLLSHFLGGSPASKRASRRRPHGKIRRSLDRSTTDRTTLSPALSFHAATAGFEPSIARRPATMMIRRSNLTIEVIRWRTLALAFELQTGRGEGGATVNTFS